MKVICKQTTSKGFDLKIVQTIRSNEFDYSYGGYGLELEKEYTVMGILMYQHSQCTYYLIDTNGKPNLFPNLLFTTSDNSIPKNWFFNLMNNDINFYMLAGFDELCNNEKFLYDLIERDETAMRIYFRRKIELEKEYDRMLND